MTKVPCGGFKLDNNFLDMNENDELSLTGGGEGKAYQYVVTDGDGSVKWEDRLTYEDSRVVVPPGGQTGFAKVADEVPSWASAEASVKVWQPNASNIVVNPEAYLVLENGSFFVTRNSSLLAVFITEDNTEFSFGAETALFPEKGVYFYFFKDNLYYYIAGIASADSDTPEITWDGNIDMIKKLDEKFLPDMLILYEHEVA